MFRTERTAREKYKSVSLHKTRTKMTFFIRKSGVRELTVGFLRFGDLSHGMVDIEKKKQKEKEKKMANGKTRRRRCDRMMTIKPPPPHPIKTYYVRPLFYRRDYKCSRKDGAEKNVGRQAGRHDRERRKKNKTTTAPVHTSINVLYIRSAINVLRKHFVAIDVLISVKCAALCTYTHTYTHVTVADMKTHTRCTHTHAPEWLKCDSKQPRACTCPAAE